MLVSIAAYTLIWGCRSPRLRRAAVRARDGPLDPAQARGRQPAAAWCSSRSSAPSSARKSLGGNALAEARVGLAGPILGSLGALAVALSAIAFDSEMLRALAFTGFFLNLFNLLPVVPLDGGRAMAAMAPWMWFVGLGAVVCWSSCGRTRS